MPRPVMDANAVNFENKPEKKAFFNQPDITALPIRPLQIKNI
jgi:hypothetical protein